MSINTITMQTFIQFLTEAAKKPFKKIKKGAFHDWLGKSPDSPITAADIEKGLRSKDPKVVKMANFAKNAKKFKH